MRVSIYYLILAYMYYMKTDYFPFFLQMATAVQQRAFTPAVLVRLQSMEQEFGISASSLDRPGKSPTDMAHWAVKQLQDTGRLPVLLDSDDYICPTVDINEDSMNHEPNFDDSHNRVVEDEERFSLPPSVRGMGSGPMSMEALAALANSHFNANAAGSSPAMPALPTSANNFPSFAIDPFTTLPPSSSFVKAPPTDEEVAQAEKQRKEKAAEQARLATEREQEAQKRKAIKDQIELDRQVRIKEAEEKKRSQKEAMQLSQLQSLSEATVTPRSAASSSALASPSTQSHNETSSSAPSSYEGEQSISAATASSQHSLNPYNNSSQPTMVRGVTGHSSGHSSTNSSVPVTYPSYVTTASSPIRPAGNSNLFGALASIEEERNKAIQAVRIIEAHFRQDPANINPALQQNLRAWTARAEELDMYYTSLSAAAAQENGVEYRRAPSFSAAPTAPAGFTLREQGDQLLYEDEEAVEGRELVLSADETTWQVRVRLTDGKLITVKLNPSHTVGDLLHHVGSFAPLTSRNRLEVSGKKVELPLDWTAEKAELRSTTLVVTLK